jgi:hypothetical protein
MNSLNIEVSRCRARKSGSELRGAAAVTSSEGDMEEADLTHAPTEHVGTCVYIIYSGGLHSWSCHRCSSAYGTCSNATKPSTDPALVSLNPPNCAFGPYGPVTTTSASGVKSIPMTSSDPVTPGPSASVAQIAP